MSIADKDIDAVIETAEQPIQQLTNWKNEPTLTELKEDYEAARESHDIHVTEVTTWLDNMHIRGDAKPKTKEGFSKIQPKTIRKNNEWRYAALSEPFLSTDDIFNTSPRTYEDVDAAEQNGLVLNYQFNNLLNKQEFIDELVRVFVDEGTAIVRVGWETITRKKTVKVPQFKYLVSTDPLILARNMHMTQVMESNPNAYHILPLADIKAHEVFLETGRLVTATHIGDVEEEQDVIIKDQPTLDICNYNNVVIDPSANGIIEDAKYIIHSFKTSYSELKAEGKYKNLDSIIISANTPDNDPDFTEKAAVPHESTTYNLKDKPRKEIVAYEYWGYRDIDGSGVLRGFVATWVGNTCIYMDENPYSDDRLPFVLIPYMPIRGDNYGEPDGELIFDNQQIIGATTRGMVDVMARGSNGQQGTRKGALDAHNKRLFKRGENYEFNGNVDASSLVYMHKFDELPASSQVMLATQQAEVESMSGVKAFSNGITGQALGETVGGQKNAMDAASKREMGILRRLANGMVKIGRLITGLNSELLTQDQVIRITNDKFVTIRPDDLTGKFDVNLSISTPEEDDAKASEIAFQLQTLGNSVDFGITKILLVKQAKLRKMPDVAKALEEYEPQPDPLEEQKKLLEIQLLQAQLQNELINGGLDKAKIGESQAKTQKLLAETDQIELNTVEQEEGVQQERAKELAKEQSKGNIDLKVVEKTLENLNQSGNNATTTDK